MIDDVLRPPLPQAREELRVSAVTDKSVHKDGIVVLWGWAGGRVKSRLGLRYEVRAIQFASQGWTRAVLLKDLSGSFSHPALGRPMR